MLLALCAEGQTYRGFLVTKYLPLVELQSTLIELVHEATGAGVIAILNDDPENLFSLSFQTLPQSSNGVAHILEHTVLCGSKRFPIKDPFFSMTRRSLNTYMNALTGQDFTCYPASSQVEKDFYNLLEVYLDAVFHPQLKQLSFLQEGHRLGFSEPHHKDNRLQFQGVVYNEMKGSMSNPDQRLCFHLFKHLLPDLPYAHNSGGDPKEIPNLTYEELTLFHKTFYHPSRCLFFFYGNLPLAKHLDYIEKHALKGVEKAPFLPPIPRQKRFHAPLHIKEYYPIAANEDPTKKTILAIGFLTASISEQTDLLGLSLLDSLLTDTDVSPLKLAVLKSNLASILESSLDLEMSEVPWVFFCKGCEQDSGPKILELIQKTLTDLCRTGFDPDEIEASLHQLEFQRMEIGGDGGPFGLSLFFRSALAKQHGADPEQALLIHSLFHNLRARLKDSRYLPSLIERYLLNNPHHVLLTMSPDPHLEQKEQKEEEMRLSHIRSKLTNQAIQDLLQQEKDLEAFQSEIEHQSLDCLPKITLDDVPKQAKNYPLAVLKQDGLEIAHHACFTNTIVYADLVYDLPALSSDDLTLLPFLCKILTEIGCAEKSYEEVLKLQQATVGELIAALSPFVPHGASVTCLPAFSFRAKVMNRNTGALFDLFRDFSLSAQLQDPTRVKELLNEHATGLSGRLTKQAMSYATQMALSSLSRPSALLNQWQGLPYFEAVAQWSHTFSQDFLNRLEKLYQSLLGSKSPSLVLGCSQEDRKKYVDPHLAKLADALPHRHLPEWNIKTILTPQVTAQARIIAAPVAFNVLAFSAVSYEHADSAPLLVATDLLENTSLHNEVREKGGAYGSGASYSPTLGQFHFYSYRDPHLARTYAAFHKAIDKIASGKFTERELEEAKLGILQTLDAPVPPGQRAHTAFSWHRTGRAYELRNAYRQAVLNTTKKEIANAVERHLKAVKDRGIFVSFAGEDLLKKEAPKLPFTLEIQPICTL